MILAWLSAAFVAGVAVGAAVSPEPAASLVLAAICVLCAALLRRRREFLPLLVLAAALLGFARAPHSVPPSPGDLAYYNGRVVQVTGVIDAEPDIRDTGANYAVAVSEAAVHGRSLKLSGTLWVHTTRAVELEYGDRVTVTGRLRVPHLSPVRGAASEMRFPKVTDGGPTDTGPLGWVVPLRQHLENGIDRWLPEPEAALLIAITLGARSASLGDLAPALVSTGLIHLIAVSGIKVALVAGTAHQLLRRLGSRLLALASSLVVLAGYVLITGATVSGLRSAVMWALVFMGTYLGRGTVALVSLGFAAAVMVGVDPNLLSDIGFQLSVVGTLCIVAFSDTLNGRLRFLPSPLKESFSTSLAAQVGTLPIVIAGFHVLSLTGPVANTLVLPLLPALILLGFFLGLAANVPSIAAPLSALAFVLLHAVVSLAQAFASALGDIPSAGLSPPVIVIYFVVVSGLVLLALKRSRWAPLGTGHGTSRQIALALGAACVLLSGSLAISRAESSPTLYWLGTGDAFVLRSAGMTVLIGGSPRPSLFLRRLSEVVPYDDRTVDLAIVTDPRSATSSIYQPLLSHYSLSEVLDVGSQYSTETYGRWRALLRSRRIPAYLLRTGATVDAGPAHIEAIAPDGPCDVPQNCAAMLRIRIGARTVLLTGTADAREQEESIFRNVSVRADVLVCPVAPCNPLLTGAASPRMVFSPPGGRPSGRWMRLTGAGTTVITEGGPDA